MDVQRCSKDHSKSVPYEEDIDFSIIRDEISKIGENCSYTRDIPISLNFMEKPRTPQWIPKIMGDFTPYLSLNEDP